MRTDPALDLRRVLLYAAALVAIYTVGVVVIIATHTQSDPQPRPHGRRRRVQAEVQLVLPGVQPLPGDLHQHRELGLIVRRAKVLDDPAHPGTLVHDPHGRRPRRGLHRPHERGHIVRIPGTLSAPSQPPTRP